MSTPLRDRRGSNAIEFGLVFPLLIVVIGAMLDFSWFFFQEQTVMAAVRGAVREVAVVDFDASDGDWDRLVVARAQASLRDAGFRDLGVVRAMDDGAGWPNQLVGVQVNLPYQPLIGLTPVPQAISWQFMMRVEDQGPDPSTS